ncbi:MAG: MFS transporter [Ignavibacteriae bacterium]|nr:MFS transporter [Ignavibacteria bacterium]MBI3365449.1 MFS transporter [Ignavibacteriota bacterium]
MSKPQTQFNKNLISLLFTVFIDFVGFGIVLPIMAPVLLDAAHGVLSPETSLATREFILGLNIAAFPMAQFFAAPVLGVLSDKYGRKVMLLLLIFGTSVSLALFAIGILRRSLFLLFFSRILNGITGGNVSIAQSAMADMSDPASRARNFGLIGMAFGLGFILGPFFGGKLADPQTVSWFNYATPFWFAAILSFVNVLLIWFWFRETLTTRNLEAKINPVAGFQHIAKAFSHSSLRTIFAVVFLSMFGFTFFTQFFQVYLIEKFSFTQSQIGVLYAYIGLWIAFTQGGVTRILSRRVPPNMVLRVSLLTLSIGLISLLLPQQSSLLYFVLPFIALSQGTTMPNATALVSNSVSMQDQGEILGINQSVQSVAFAIPPIIAGIVSSIDVRLPLILASTFAFLAWITYIIFYKPQTIMNRQG